MFVAGAGFSAENEEGLPQRLARKEESALKSGLGALCDREEESAD